MRIIVLLTFAISFTTLASNVTAGTNLSNDLVNLCLSVNKVVGDKGQTKYFEREVASRGIQHRQHLADNNVAEDRKTSGTEMISEFYRKCSDHYVAYSGEAGERL